MDHNYGRIAENKAVNNSIYYCFNFINEKEQKRFVKKFKNQPHTNIQIMHTYRELLVGAYISANGIKVENERKIGTKTPDWSITDQSDNVIAIIEVINHHIDEKTNEPILEQFKAGKKAIAFFPNGNDPENKRLYLHIQDKANKYKDLVKGINVPYVVAVFMDFLTVIDDQETKECLMDGKEPLFRLYPDLSGVLHFEESNGSYKFTYIENPFALRKITIPSGWLLKSV